MGKNIGIAFLLNLFFSIFEVVGGIVTGSVAILSDAIHDMGDAASIGISYLLEKQSKKQANAVYTYGYARYSIVGGLITSLIVLIGSCIVVYNAIRRLFHPVPLSYDGILWFAVGGIAVNGLAAYLTHKGDSINQKAVNLHMWEDAFGWVAVFLGAILMRFTGWGWLDSCLSIWVSLFVIFHAAKNVGEVMNVFLEKVPSHISLNELRGHLLTVEGVLDVHHIHIWSMDEVRVYATMHIVAEGDFHQLKEDIREELRKHGICHVTLEIEQEGECCHEQSCKETEYLSGRCIHHCH